MRLGGQAVSTRSKAWSSGSSGPLFLAPEEARVARTVVESIIRIQVDQAFLVQPDVQSLKYSVKRAIVSPIAELLITVDQGAKRSGKSRQAVPGAEDSEDAVKHQMIITAWPAHLLLFRVTRYLVNPGCVGE